MTAIVGMLAIAISRTTPLVLGAHSGIVSERSGITNIAIEGMMLAAAFFGFAVAALTHNLAAALVAGMLAGMVLAGLHGVLSIHGRIDQIISGTVVNILSVGITGYMNRRLFPTGATGVPQLAPLLVPGLSALPGLGRVLFSHQPITYFALLLPVLAHIALYRTSWGLRTRAVGEHPLAAESAGVDVVRLRYMNVLLSGLLAGLGGAYFTLESVAHFEPLMTNGRGFIALAAMIFGKWTPLGAWGGALLFGIAEALPVTLQLQGLEVNYFLLGMLPYLLTIIVLAGAVGRASPPAALGLPYVKGY